MINDEAAEKMLKEATEQGLKLCRQIVTDVDEFPKSAITFGTAIGAIYYTLQQASKEAAESWLNACFITMTGGLKNKGIDFSVKWERKD